MSLFTLNILINSTINLPTKACVPGSVSDYNQQYGVILLFLQHFVYPGHAAAV